MKIINRIHEDITFKPLLSQAEIISMANEFLEPELLEDAKELNVEERMAMAKTLRRWATQLHASSTRIVILRTVLN